MSFVIGSPEGNIWGMKLVRNWFTTAQAIEEYTAGLAIRTGMDER